MQTLLPGTLKNLFFPPEKTEFAYFAAAKAHPFAVGDHLVKAAWAADAAMLAYARYGPKPMQLQDLEDNLGHGGLRLVKQIGDWSNHGPQAFLASNDQFAILSFRGTEADDPVDVFDDCDAITFREPDHRPDGIPPRFSLELLTQVHQGFQRSLNRLWDDVRNCVVDYRRNHPQAEICFTGHSLGAALAVLASSRFSDPNISLYTFGCPRVGNQAFVDRVLDKPSKQIFRFVNVNDSVAHVPPESIFYRHVPETCLRFDDKGQLAEDNGSFLGDVEALATVVSRFSVDLTLDLSKIDARPGLVDHSAARYCMRLSNLLLPAPPTKA